MADNDPGIVSAPGVVGVTPLAPAPETPALALSGRGRWMALTAALLGWMFDGLEMGLFPQVARPALRELLGDRMLTAEGRLELDLALRAGRLAQRHAPGPAGDLD